MEKVTMLIWQFRDDPAVVQFMAQFVARVSFVLYRIMYLLSIEILVNDVDLDSITDVVNISSVKSTVLGLPLHLRWN